MAVRNKKPQAPPDEARLRQIICAELQKNDENSGQPIIQIETTPRGTIRIIVIWDDWQNLDQGQRSTVIMDAFRDYWQSAGTPEKIVDVTIAMGLTAKEAANLGVT